MMNVPIEMEVWASSLIVCKCHTQRHPIATQALQNNGTQHTSTTDSLERCATFDYSACILSWHSGL